MDRFVLELGFTKEAVDCDPKIDPSKVLNCSTQQDFFRYSMCFFSETINCFSSIITWIYLFIVSKRLWEGLWHFLRFGNKNLKSPFSRLLQSVSTCSKLKKKQSLSCQTTGWTFYWKVVVERHPIVNLTICMFLFLLLEWEIWWLRKPKTATSYDLIRKSVSLYSGVSGSTSWVKISSCWFFSSPSVINTNTLVLLPSFEAEKA